MPTKQEIFNRVVAHARKQQKKSQVYNVEEQKTICMYRSTDENGDTLKCFAGVEIPDVLYKPILENQSCDSLCLYRWVWSPLGYTKENITFLQRLQSTHDSFGVSEWEYRFQMLAEEFQLQVPPIGES